MSKRSNRVAVVVALGVAGAAAGQCIEGDVNGDGIVNGIDLAYVLQNWNQTCPAVIEAVTPPAGLPAGGTPITITGEQLGGVLSVTIGGVPATNVVGVNATTITAVTPPSKSLGPKDVVVVTTASTATLSAGFTYSFLSWGTVLEFAPDPAVITSAEWRERIIATGFPWRVQDNASGIEMLLVPAGTFMMGCSSPPQSEGCGADEFPVHAVTLTQHYYLGRFEVTQSVWTAVMGGNPSYFQSYPNSPSQPVDSVSWNSIQLFLGQTNLRLPTEAEWENACRAGTDPAFNIPPLGSSNDGVVPQLAWYTGNNGSQGSPLYGTKPVGLKGANNLGFHDMHGNVWEWVNDWYGSAYYSESPSTDPSGPIGGDYRVLRGGSWSDQSGSCRSSRRGFQPPHQSNFWLGFRVARDAGY